jgi:hypothetical protein
MNKLTYKYYVAVESEEHMLFTSEIAQMYQLMLANQPRHRLVSSILRKYIRQNHPEYESHFYETRYGLREVFSEKVYKPAMEQYFKEEGL